MTKWVENKDVVFTCQRDVFIYLLDKKHAVRSKIYDGVIAFFDDDGNMAAWSFNSYKEWIPMKRAEWYEDIPENGILCFVGFNQVSLIKTYKDGWFYSVSGMYKEATPLTKEEALQHILPY